MVKPSEPLRLHRKIYPARALTETVEAFAELVEAEIDKEGEYHLVRLSPLDDDHPLETLRLEFANYALGRAARLR